MPTRKATTASSTTSPIPLPAAPVPERWLTRQQLRSEFNIALPTMTIIRWMKLGKFPMKHTVDGQDVWKESAILQWRERQ